MRHYDDAGWSNPKVLAILAVVFVCGAVVGAAGMREYLHRHMPSSAQGPTLVYGGRRVSLAQLKSELHLTPEQERTVDTVLDDYAKFYQNLYDQRESILEDGHQRILNALDPQQRQKFEQLFASRPPSKSVDARPN